MIVIGADTHKRTHALAAVDAGTGRQRGARQIEAEESGHLAAVRWARGLDEERVWAIEDCRHVSRPLRAGVDRGRGAGRPRRSAQDGCFQARRARAGQVGPDRRARDRPGGGQGRRGALSRRPPRSARDGDPAALRSPQGSRRRAHPGAEPVALASAGALPRTRALARARLARRCPPARPGPIDACVGCPPAPGYGSRASRSRSCAC